MTHAEHIAMLIYKELNDCLTVDEASELAAWKNEHTDYSSLYNEVNDPDQLAKLIQLHHPANKETVKRNINRKMEGTVTVKQLRLNVTWTLELVLLSGGQISTWRSRHTREH